MVEKNEAPCINVATKLTKREYSDLLEWTNRLGVSKYKFIRHCLLQQMKDLKMIAYE